MTPPSPLNTLLRGDCLELLAAVPARSVHLVLCDLPYGTTQNRWDSVVDLPKLWAAYERVLAPGGVVVLTSQGLFTAKLILSNERLFRYKWVWQKSKPTNFLNARRQPLRAHEDICVFYADPPTYQPQMTPGEAYDKGVRKDQLTGSYGVFGQVHVRSDGERYPIDVIRFKTAESEGPVWHPTQKPVALGRYLVRTYTRPGDVVLDNCFGSGSFLVAALAEGRNFVGMELDTPPIYFRTEVGFAGASLDFHELARLRLHATWAELPEAVRATVQPSPLLTGMTGPAPELPRNPRRARGPVGTLLDHPS